MREFAEKLGQNLESAVADRVVILEEGVPAHVWLSYSDYAGLLAREEVSFPDTPPLISSDPTAGKTLLDLFDHPAFDNLPEDFEFPKLDLQFRPADFS
jgi:hypothetical protein